MNIKNRTKTKNHLLTFISFELNRIDIYIEHWLRKVNKSTDVDGQKNDINGCLLLHT